MSEIWKPVVGYEGMYEVSNLGNVRSFQKGMNRMLKPCRGRENYLRVSLYKNGKQKSCSVHRMVLTAFVGPVPKGLECGHLNGNRDDNRLENLAYITREENAQHKISHGTQAHGERHGMAKLTEDLVEEIKRRYQRASYHNSNAQELARKYGVCKSTIQNIVKGRYWNSEARQALKREGGSDEQM